jgi:hypothetical protein
MTIMYADNPQMTGGQPLNGAELSGVAYVYAEIDPAGVVKVTWLIDGIVHRDDDLGAPFSLNPNAGVLAGAYNFAELAEGAHAICILVEHTAGAPTFDQAGITVEAGPGPGPFPSQRGPGGNVRPPHTPPWDQPPSEGVDSLAELNALFASGPRPDEVIVMNAPFGGSGYDTAKILYPGGTPEANAFVRPPLGQRFSFAPTFKAGANYITVGGCSAACWIRPGAAGLVKRSGLWRPSGTSGYFGLYGGTEDCFVVEPVITVPQISDIIQVKADVGNIVRPLIAYGWLAGAIFETPGSHVDATQFVGYSGFGTFDATVRGMVVGPTHNAAVQQAELGGLFTIDNCWFGPSEGKTIQGGSPEFPPGTALLLKDTDIVGSANFPQVGSLPWDVLAVDGCNATGTVTVGGVGYSVGAVVPGMPGLPPDLWVGECPV